MRWLLPRWIPRGDGKLLYEFLPQDTSRQTHALREALMIIDRHSNKNGHLTLLDLGCGAGDSYDEFYDCAERIRWIGLDIMDSGEVGARTRRSLPFCSFDGVHIPLADNSTDITYSRQVFEHVRYPESLLREIHRILKPGSSFVGSTSHLEPFHSRSYWNYTPYGFSVMLRDAGFRSIIVRPGIDSLTLIGRRYLGYFKLASLCEPFFRIESPLNVALEAALRVLRQPPTRRNAFKLLFAGQFCFQAVK